MIAKVIVDVPAFQTDREFDYSIPKQYIDVIVPGVRVIVPFGPRKIQGFVVSLEEESELEELKEILAPMDLTPVLNEELLQLGDWLTERTMSYKISAFQVMLPPALKAKYEKKIALLSACEELPTQLQSLFLGQDTIKWEEAETYFHLIHKEILNKRLEVRYEVKDRVKMKKRKYILPNKTVTELQDVLDTLPLNAEKQKLILNFFLKLPEPIQLSELTTYLNVATASVSSLVKKGFLKEEEVEVYRDPYHNRHFKKTTSLKLTQEQELAISPILNSINEKQQNVFLLYGVTGSGKTEIYLQSIENVLKEGREAIVLVPEISLTPQMVERFKGRFGDQVAVLHSALSVGEKYDEWRKIQRKEVKVVVGARSAIFAPFENIGIIIIDEEHETSYKQEDNPRYHARDVAIWRSQYHHCPVVLGSATPSLESFARAAKDVYKLLTLPKRMNDRELPAVDVLDMREELREGNRSMFSRVLIEKIKDRLEKKQQIVLFLNKRGHSSFVMCRDCGYVVNCPQCDISLTYHQYNQRMKCHYCAFEVPVPLNCPECHSEHIRYFGTGTQKVEEELGKVIPEARVIRMDVDTTGRKGSHERLLNEFQEGKADILLGTQMIAKGLDFPNITLVGVLSADTMLHLPDFRSSEKTFQLLTQVSGRAGRHDLPGEVIVQTYTPEHYSIQLAAKQDFQQFFEREMYIRKMHRYPPYYYIALITVSHENVANVAKITESITKFVASKLSEEANVLGPVASPISRIKNRYRYQCLIKYKREPELTKTLKTVLQHYQQEIATKGLQIHIDVNPYILM